MSTKESYLRSIGCVGMALEAARLEAAWLEYARLEAARLEAAQTTVARPICWELAKRIQNNLMLLARAIPSDLVGPVHATLDMADILLDAIAVLEEQHDAMAEKIKDCAMKSSIAKEDRSRFEP